MSNCVITTCSIHFTLRRTNSLVDLDTVWKGNNLCFLNEFWAVFHDLKASSWSFEVLRSIFGPSSALAASAQTSMRETQYVIHSSPSSAIDDALNVSGCSYETNTAWGKEVGRLMIAILIKI